MDLGGLWISKDEENLTTINYRIIASINQSHSSILKCGWEDPSLRHRKTDCCLWNRRGEHDA